ncbi:peptidoglycan-binding protein [Salinibacterium sp. NYA9b]
MSTADYFAAPASPFGEVSDVDADGAALSEWESSSAWEDFADDEGPSIAEPVGGDVTAEEDGWETSEDEWVTSEFFDEGAREAGDEWQREPSESLQAEGDFESEQECEVDEEDEWEASFEDQASAPAPAQVGAPHAPVPSTGAHFPVRSTHAQPTEVNYKASDGTGVGRNAGRRFSAGRPARGPFTRRHCAVDLNAEIGDEVVACEDGRIVAFYGFCCGQTKTTWALLVEHPQVVINYGEVSPDSLTRHGLKVGDTVTAGQTIGLIGRNPGGGHMLHFEMYTRGTTRNKRWTHGQAAPVGLLDPTTYLLATLGTTASGPSPAPRSAPTPPTPGPVRPTLRRGARGSAVRELQTALSAAGFATASDGIFGAGTQARVKAFQAARGLSADGVVGPITWAALGSPAASAAAGAGAAGAGAGSASSTTSSGAAGSASTSANLAGITLGTLECTTPRGTFTYPFSADDLIWSAKLLVHEAGGADNADNAAVLWAMFNSFALFTHTVYPTFTRFIRAYSTTLQPELRNRRAAERHYNRPSSHFVRTGGVYPGTNIPRGQLQRHLDVQRQPWSAVKLSARQLAQRALQGNLPNPGIGLASEFASTRVYYRQNHGGAEPTLQQWLEYTHTFARRKNWQFVGDISGLDPRKNAFFLDNRARSLPTDAVRVIPATGAREHEWEYEFGEIGELDEAFGASEHVDAG